MARKLRQNMMAYNKRCVAMLLADWTKRPTEKSATTTAACPALGACITEAGLNEELAVTMTGGTLNDLTTKYNALHDMLQLMGKVRR